VPILSSHGVGIHYEVHGTGRPVMLLHGGTVDFARNYAGFGWVKLLNDRGLQVIGLDFRGHGGSDKPHDADAYGTANLAGDVLAVLDHLGVTRASLVAYSIGTAVALHLIHEQPARFESAVLVATGDGLIGVPPHTLDRILPALARLADRTEYPRDMPRHLAAYWNFIEATSGDRAAMRAVATARYPHLPEHAAAAIVVRTLVVSGENDPVLGRGERLARALGRGTYLQIPGADHFSLAADPVVQAAVADFLDAEAAAPAGGA
jgi:pimeloyl-ACP methyl ester carboxylesterase